MMFNFRRAWPLMEAFTILVLSPLQVWAHHCSSASDCWNTAAAEIAASLGIAAATALAVTFRVVRTVPHPPKVSPPKSREKRIRDSCRIS
jgi:hypothetical protein